MKKLNIFLSALALSGMMLTSCDEKQELPPVAFPEGGSEETIGTGTWDDPFSVWQVLAGVEMGEQDFVWATGYIVGYINTFDGDYAKLREKSAVFGTAGAPKSNLLLAMTPDETNWENCIPVQLAYNTIGRDINLQDHPEYLHRQVTLKGTTGANYLSVYGLRNCDNYNWGPEGIYVAPPQKFEKVDHLIDGGEYVLVAGNKYLAQPLGETYTYGYLYVEEVTAGSTVSANIDNAFKFMAQDGHWVIKDSYDRYLYMDASRQNFQVSVELPDSNYLWDVTFDDNGTAVIKNVSRGTWIQYDPNYSSYGCYPDSRGLLPALYLHIVDEE